MTASGTFGYGVEFADFVPLEQIGGIIVKGTTLNPREGNDYPRMAETASGMLNCVGLQNKGVDYFAKNIYPEIKDIDTNMIVNVSGSSPEDYAECAARVDALEKIPAIELTAPLINQSLFIDSSRDLLAMSTLLNSLWGNSGSSSSSTGRSMPRMRSAFIF